MNVRAAAPAYNYIPWQKTAAGLGGTYHAATSTALASALIAAATAPLQKQIDTLTKAKATAEKASARPAVA